MSNTRFFILSGNGFARFQPFDGKEWGVFHVRSFAETEWVEAGLADVERVASDVASGRLVEFSPASLLASVPSPARAFASRANGAKGGRPRKFFPFVCDRCGSSFRAEMLFDSSVPLCTSCRK